MKFPISFGWNGNRRYNSKPYSYGETDSFGSDYVRVMRVKKLQVFISRQLFLLSCAPGWLLHKITHRYYYGRLEYQYQAGHAAGLREGLMNRDTYFEMTSEELAASLGITAEQAERLHTKEFMARRAAGLRPR